jgi:rhodanese-related sulfurtransferase
VFASVSPQEGNELVNAGAVLLDIREDNEWVAGHASIAIHAPMSSIQNTPLPFDSAAKVVVICRSGQRSQKVTAWLAGQGIDAINYEEGMHGWVRLGGDILDAQGNLGLVI